jgi:heme/copper-type cytochrome/quinol oxidase subunit 4
VQEIENKKIAEHVFTGSIAMVGVCLTVITLFSIAKTGVTSYADEILAINAFIFIISSLISYLSLRRGSERRLERFADIVFFTGMIIMVVAGVLIVFFP